MAPQKPATSTLTITLADSEKEELNKISFAKSEPGDRVSAAEVVREAIRDYLDKYEQTPEACIPQERGTVAPDNEGTA